MIRVQSHHLGVASFTRVGLHGRVNQDRFAITSYRGTTAKPVLFALIADGMGGQRAGEVAAELTVQYILKTVTESKGAHPLRTMTAAIQSASQAIAARSAGRAEEEGMGSTCACVWVEGDRLYTSYVGDSRIYLLRSGKIQCTSVDHTWVQEALEAGTITPEQAHGHPNAHVVRRHLGAVELPDVDTRLRLSSKDDDHQAKRNQGTQLQPGDTLLMCTDGLTGAVWDDDILRLVSTRNTLESAAEDLVDRARERGGQDDVTVILLRVLPAQPIEGGWRLWLRRVLGN